MAKTIEQAVAEANAVVPRLSPPQAKELIAGGAVVLVDVRDLPEVRATGLIAGALHIPTNVFAAQADPQSASHNQALAADRTILLYCASGIRSALAGKYLKDLGFPEVYNAGGFQDLARFGVPVQR